MQNLIGQSLGRYHILEKLGEGGMATVYKAYDTRLERDVAVKIIRSDLFGSSVIERMLKRFEREAKSMAKLSHANILKVLDYGEHEGSPYLVMELLSGGTLKEKFGHPMSWREAVRLLEPVANALAYAHSINILHRDVKPGNILISATGTPVLTDFGIAKLLDSEEGQTLTGTGVGVGTPEYMAPEQGLGKEADGRADIYSLGIVFFELVTGQKPYHAETPLAVLLKQVNDPLPDPRSIVPNLPEPVAKVIFKALAKDPAHRYQTMDEFANALNKLANVVLGEDDLTFSKINQPRPAQVMDAQATMDKLSDIPVAHVKPVRQSRPVPENTNKPIRFNRKYLGFILGGITLLVLIVGLANGWFRPKTVAAPTETLLPTEAAVALPAETPKQTEAPTAENLELSAGTIKISDVDGMPMVYVPAGEFSMGSSNGDNDEKPVHTVFLDSYWIDQTEVTNAMYAQCVTAGVCSIPSIPSSYTRDSYYGNTQYNDYPVIYVNWQQAKDYCQWAGRSLPSEAQWEKAARGPDGNTYPWGNNSPKPTLANYVNSKGDTTPVGSYPEGASPYGALDMTGNVWEWVADWYAVEYYASQISWNNPQGASTGVYRLLRGGSWSSGMDFIRSSYRYRGYPESSSSGDGFRCALSVSVSP